MKKSQQKDYTNTTRLKQHKKLKHTDKNKGFYTARTPNERKFEKYYKNNEKTLDKTKAKDIIADEERQTAVCIWTELSRRFT